MCRNRRRSLLLKLQRPVIVDRRVDQRIVEEADEVASELSVPFRLARLRVCLLLSFDRVLVERLVEGARAPLNNQRIVAVGVEILLVLRVHQSGFTVRRTDRDQHAVRGHEGRRRLRRARSSRRCR